MQAPKGKQGGPQTPNFQTQPDYSRTAVDQLRAEIAALRQQLQNSNRGSYHPPQQQLSYNNSHRSQYSGQSAPPAAGRKDRRGPRSKLPGWGTVGHQNYWGCGICGLKEHRKADCRTPVCPRSPAPARVSAGAVRGEGEREEIDKPRRPSLAPNGSAVKSEGVKAAPRPWISVLISGHVVTGLIDTGAQVSSVDVAVASRGEGEIRAASLGLVAVGNQGVSTVGEMDV
uniref:Uncharacterized protein n=1 Tax=Chromera velia CCMP2878 TaxID=1169474 RepID=A0A0G4EZQ9_9ALVE|eukprot:Cvel_14367.t1-p1 / transcript=Cvel_14367.t1 / gene=Cvel_14367 / organism=Chromera_velia_CCMP2878 / gene_product=hypothetical protein / transcript_product=hypothetical protein / location=Cvel_scaffold1019:56709-57475(+) / protein_length=227 / sequence_SO=supercontig / SO=protein_coding / is_pseudo=false